MIQFFKKLKDFLISKFGKNQTLVVHELDPIEPDLPQEVVPFELHESDSKVQDVYTDCDCECGNNSCKDSGWEVLHNESCQQEPQKEDAQVPGPASISEPELKEEKSVIAEEPKKAEKKSKGRPKKKETRASQEKPADKKGTSKPKKNYYEKKKRSKDAE